MRKPIRPSPKRSGKPSEGGAPDPRKSVKDWVFRHFGWPGLIVMLVLGFVVANHKELPGLIEHIQSALHRPQALPKAKQGQFNLALAHLAGDKEYAMEKLILADLRKFDGINLLRFDRTLALDMTLQPEQAELKGHEQAQRLLQESGADVLIWGEMMMDGSGSQSAPQLFWTANAAPQQPHAGNIYPPENFRLPPIFWDQLKAVLALRINTVASRFRGLQGHYLADQLQPFIDQVQRLLDPSDHRPEWNPDQRATMLLALADARKTLGDQTGNNDVLQQAIHDYEQTLLIQTRERVPLDWAMTQNNLGTALQSLGERESGTARLEAAVTAYEAALAERTRERVPLEWAMTQNNLGTVLFRLGERESGTARLEAAVTAYEAALTELTRERVPLNWATTQHNLGTALTSLGERESGTARLEAAVTAYEAALTEWTRERVPLDWAMTQNNLGNALRSLGERESDTARLEAAVTAYENALNEWIPGKVPKEWITAAKAKLEAARSGIARRQASPAAAFRKP